ncbi:hypothetical protein FACS1894105_05760 [Clostridia bacterium]|nr:hypothetical protein FACS1894105_05760 [Clostridia bacterium]
MSELYISITPRITQTQIGKTLYTVSSECSPTATETVEQKMKRLICRHISDFSHVENLSISSAHNA